MFSQNRFVHRCETVFEHSARKIRRSIGHQIEQRRNDSIWLADRDRFALVLAFKFGAYIHEDRCSANAGRKHIRAHVIVS
jgi:hypothetical protein